MKFSIKTKLSLLFATFLAITIATLLFLTFDNVREITIKMEKDAFNNILMIETSNINTSYLNLLANKVSQVLLRKESLRVKAQEYQVLAENISKASSIDLNDEKTFLTSTLYALSNEHVSLELYSDEFSVFTTSNSFLANAKNMDYKGRTAKNMLQTNVVRSTGDFAVFEVELEGELKPYIFFFYPIEVNDLSGNVKAAMLVCVSPIDDLENIANQAIANIIDTTKEKFARLNLYNNAFIGLLDGQAKILTSQGQAESISPNIIDEQMQLSKIQGSSSASYMHELYGEVFVSTIYIKALDWYMILSAPLVEIEKPTTLLLTKLASISLIIMFLALFFSLLFLIYTIKPLAKLSVKTKEFAVMDLSSKDIANKIQVLMSDLDLTKSDEIGELSRSFGKMSEALANNISALVDATSAQERMQGELNAARDIQLSILANPELAPCNDKLASAVFLEPAKEVGGDLYDYFVNDEGKQILVIGDVSGKGVPAALFMSMTAILIRYAMKTESNPAIAMSKINNILEQNNATNMFVTLFIASYDQDSGTIEYANAGHCLPYIINSKSGELRILENLSGPMLGVFRDTEYILYQDCLVQNEQCLLYTDGVTEAMSEEYKLYSDERLLEFMRKNCTLSPQEMLTKLYESVVEYRGSAQPSDDITMLSFAKLK